MQSWQSRDGADDFYESSYNWPLLYLLGGGDHLLLAGATAVGCNHGAAHPTRSGVHMNMNEGTISFTRARATFISIILCLADPDEPHVGGARQTLRGIVPE